MNVTARMQAIHRALRSSRKEKPEEKSPQKKKEEPPITLSRDVVQDLFKALEATPADPHSDPHSKELDVTDAQSDLDGAYWEDPVVDEDIVDVGHLHWPGKDLVDMQASYPRPEPKAPTPPPKKPPGISLNWMGYPRQHDGSYVQEVNMEFAILQDEAMQSDEVMYVYSTRQMRIQAGEVIDMIL